MGVKSSRYGPVSGVSRERVPGREGGGSRGRGTLLFPLCEAENWRVWGHRTVKEGVPNISPPRTVHFHGCPRNQVSSNHLKHCAS